MESASSATSPHRTPADDRRCENLSGTRRMGSSVASDQMAAKRRKETCAGEDWRQWDVHHEETGFVLVSVVRINGLDADRRP
jgi:hypothetical protein